MTQFEVFANPVLRARRAYPFIVVLQADAAQTGRDRAVAPVAPRSAFPAIPGRLTPIVKVGDDQFVLLVTSLTTIPAQSLSNAVTSLADRREDILAAIDYLFFGV
jgi:toxin CcdB